MKTLTTLLAISLLALSALLLPAQTPPTSQPATQPAAPTTPRLLIKDAPLNEKSPISLQSLDVHATLAPPLAETSITLVFANASNRQLDAELEFPLPPNSVITGYALDVPAGSGILVDGVAIEKLRARQIFESELRRRVDPGLVEHVAGNTFRTRVYPIDPQKTRTVRITYLSEIPTTAKESTYSLPLNFADALQSASLTLDVLDTTLDPASIKIDGMKNLAFEKSDTRLRATQKFQNIQLAGTLALTLPSTTKTTTRIASYLPPLPPESLQIDCKRAPDYYFYLSTQPEIAHVLIEAKALKNIAIIWDTSLSRANADKSAEIDFLAQLVKKLPDSAIVTVFDTQGRALKNFRNDPKALTQFLLAIPCDGALRLDATTLPKNSHSFKGEFDPTDNSKPTDGPVQILEGPPYDFYLFFSDGQVTLGKPQFASAPEASSAPLYTVCSDPKANHALLTKLAQSTGGLYLNLQTTKPDAAAKTLLTPRQTISLSADPKQVADIYPSGPVALIPGQRLLFTGRLLTPEATVTLKQTYGRTFTADEKITLKQENDTADRLIPIAWAMQKIADLSLDEDANADALLALGKEFNLVTPRTSLIVLETLEQYLQHRVVPPKSREELYKQFSAAIEKQTLDQFKQNEEKITRILTLWNQRIEWWNAKYEYAADFKWKNETATTSPATTGIPGPIGSGSGEGPRSAYFGSGGVASTQPSRGTTSSNNGTAVPTTPETVVRVYDTRALLVQPDNAIQPPSFNLSDINKEGKTGSGSTSTAASILIKPWLPNTPYLTALKAAKLENAYAVYLEQRKQFGDAPAFYLDCGNYFLSLNQRETAIKIFTSIAQLRLDNPNLLRIAAYRLLQLDDYEDAIDLFEKVARLRPEEPQSLRDLAQAYAARGLKMLEVANELETTSTINPSPNTGDLFKVDRSEFYKDINQALLHYNKVIMNKWDRFDEIELIALMEANALWAKIENQNSKIENDLQNPLDKRLIKNLDLDVRIVLTWDADNTDIDLHVLEPTGEEAFYSHNRTTIGGLLSKDFTQGYGPEEYCLRKALPGPYKIIANYYGSNAPTIQGPVTVQATVITNFGRPNEKREPLTLRLTDKKENQEIGTITIAPPPK